MLTPVRAQAEILDLLSNKVQETRGLPKMCIYKMSCPQVNANSMPLVASEVHVWLNQRGAMPGSTYSRRRGHRVFPNSEHLSPRELW